jgi:glutamyl-tRNA reductase
MIASLAQRAEHVRAAEMERLLRRCPGLGERERMLMMGASLTIVSKLLHPAIARIRADASLDAATIAGLFDLDVAAALAESEAFAAGETARP